MTTTTPTTEGTTMTIRPTHAESLLAPMDSGAMEYLSADTRTRRALTRNARVSQRTYRATHGYAGTAALLTAGTSQPKLGKSVAHTFGLTLSPARTIAGFMGTGITVKPLNLCPAATRGCELACLNTSGHGRFGSVQHARMVRTGFLYFDPRSAGVLLAHEISTAASKHGDIRVRLNIVSDLRWELILPRAMALLSESGVVFYDYTKFAPRLRRASAHYVLTHSASERMTDADIRALVSDGHNVAVVFNASKSDVVAAVDARMTWSGIALADGISTDDRTTDARGVIVALAALGDGIGDASGFVRPFAGIAA